LRPAAVERVVWPGSTVLDVAAYPKPTPLPDELLRESELDSIGLPAVQRAFIDVLPGRDASCRRDVDL
jgi:hypothetical protein